MPKTLSLLAVLKKIDTKGLKSLSDPQWNTFLASDTEPNEIQEKIKKLEGFERQGFAYDKTGELILEDSNAMIERFKKKTGRAKGRESLKVKLSKINVKSFKENFLDKDEKPGVDKSQNPPINFDSDSPPNPNLSPPDAEEEKEETEGLKGIRDVLDDILKVLRLDFKGDRKEARDAQKQAAKDKRKEREGKLEGGVKKSLGVIGSTLKGIEPIKKAWDSLINFLMFTLIGVLFNKTMKWFEDPKNQQKAERVGKFLKDFGPVLATAALLWLTPLGALLNGVVGLVTAIIPKLVIAIAANPWAAAAVVGTGLTVWGVSKLAGMSSRPTEAVDESVEEIGREETIEKLKEEQENRSVIGRVGDFFTGAGAEREQQIERLEGMGGNDGSTTEKTSQSFTTRGGPEAEQLKNQMAESRQNFNEGGLVQSSQLNQSNVQNYNEGGLVQSSSTQNFNEGGLVQSNQSSNVQNFNEGGLVQSNQSNQSSNVQKFNEGGLVNTYNDQKSAQNFVQNFNEGGLVQNFQGGGLVDDIAIPMIKQHEGLRLNTYNDSMGFPTIGYGHLVEENENISDTITESQADSLFKKDYQDHKKAAMNIPGYNNASVQQKAALIDLTFNMGPGWVDGFPKFKKAFASGNYEVAANELINSNWYSQVNTRGPVIVDLIRDIGGVEIENNQSFNEGGLVYQQSFNEGGLVQHYNDQKSAQHFVQNFNKGGEVPGTGNKDTVPAMLTPGEFVMSKGAVSKFGTDTLENMNSAASGPPVSSKESGTVPSMLTPGEFVVSAPAVQKYGVDTMKSMNLKGGGNNKPEVKIGANKGGLINNYNTTLMKYKGGGVVEKSVEENVSRDIVEIIKKTSEHFISLVESSGFEVNNISPSEKKIEPVETPSITSTTKTVTLPTIPKQTEELVPSNTNNEIPEFRIPIVSAQRSMVIESLGIQDLVGD